MRHQGEGGKLGEALDTLVQEESCSAQEGGNERKHRQGESSVDRRRSDRRKTKWTRTSFNRCSQTSSVSVVVVMKNRHL